jgi:arylsulfatase A-like enzyme
VAAAGGKFHSDLRSDGVDLMPLVTGRNRKPLHDVLFWRYGPSIAVREGDWKLVRQTTPKAPDKEFELYNLADDMSEKNNLAGQHPDIVHKLRADLDRINSEMIAPLW